MYFQDFSSSLYAFKHLDIHPTYTCTGVRTVTSATKKHYLSEVEQGTTAVA